MPTEARSSRSSATTHSAAENSATSFIMFAAEISFEKPGCGHPNSTLLRYLPKIGPFKGLAFNNPTPQIEGRDFQHYV